MSFQGDESGIRALQDRLTGGPAEEWATDLLNNVSECLTEIDALRAELARTNQALGEERASRPEKKRLQVEIESLKTEATHLGEYCESIHWSDEQSNTKEWLDGLRERIDALENALSLSAQVKPDCELRPPDGWLTR